jgi:PAS domain S-box-containing protein
MSGPPHPTPTLADLARHGSEAFRLMVEGARDYAIFMLGPDGVIVSWNAGAQRIKGYQAHEIIGQHFSKFYTAEALAMDWPAEELRRAIADGRFEDEGWRVRKDGTRFWANVIITAVHGNSGELLGFSKITRDLTERREYEERLRQSEENSRVLIEGVKDHAMFLIDANGDVRSWNAGAERLLGFRSFEIIGRPCSTFYTEEDAALGKPEAALAIARNAGFAEDTGWRIKADGTPMWADTSLTALHDADGSLRGFVQIVRDLTQRRRVQELEAEGQRINEFIAMLAHELRNPLAPIGNAVGILEKVGGDAQVAWCTRLIGRQMTHLSRLVDDLLDVSRITSGKIKLRREPLDLNALVQAAVESVRSTVEAYGHSLELKLAPRPLRVEGDATRLTQVIVNLLNNAAKYTPNGGRLGVSAVQRGSVVTVHVTDNGIGMSKALIDRAFELFVQGDRALDRSEGGLGIGLTLVKRIVAMHGGTVTASSGGAGQGSEFTFTIPLAMSSAASSAGPAAVSTARARGTQKILVVDDNEDAANSLAALLQMSGHQVLVAHDGPQALRLATADPPDLALLDLGLPTMDGYELARRVRGTPALAHTRLIAMTGYGQDSDRRAASGAGFEAHLVKPVEFRDLMRAIEGSVAPEGDRR